MLLESSDQCADKWLHRKEKSRTCLERRRRRWWTGRSIFLDSRQIRQEDNCIHTIIFEEPIVGPAGTATVGLPDTKAGPNLPADE